MTILYIHQYFCTPKESGATRSFWISKELIDRGHKVIMICSTNRNHPKEGIEIIDGIEVHYIKNEYTNYMSKPAKIKSFLRFVYKSIKEAKRQKDIDLVFATSTPLTVGAVALELKRHKKWPFIFEVRDLWPEFPIQIGAVKNRYLIKLLKAFERKIYRKSNHVIALSPGMRDGVMKAGIEPEKVSMVPNMSKPDEFFPREHNKEIMSKYNLTEETFKIVHFGSMGVANGLEYIIETARILDERGVGNIEFIFVGDGATLPKLKRLVEEYGLKSVKFLGYQNMSTVSEIVNLCDLSITSFKNLPILQTNSPNKLFDSLSAGIPIVVNSAGWTKDIVENENCGFYVDPEKPEDFADKIVSYKDNAEKLKEWRENARRLSIEKFDKDLLAKKVAMIIETHA